MAKKLKATDYVNQLYGVNTDTASIYEDPNATKKEKERQHDIAEMASDEGSNKLLNLYNAYRNSTDNTISLGPRTYADFNSEDNSFVIKNKKEPSKYDKEYSNALSEKTIDPLDTKISDNENQTYDMMDSALQSNSLVSKEYAMSKLQKELEYKTELLKQDKKPNGDKLSEEEKELLNTDIDVLSEALQHPETILAAEHDKFTQRITGDKEYKTNDKLLSLVHKNLNVDEQKEFIDRENKFENFNGNLSLRNKGVYKFRIRNEKTGEWEYKLGYETLGGIYSRYADSKQKGNLEILGYYQGGDAQLMEQRLHYLYKKMGVPFGDKNFGSGYTEVYKMPLALKIHSDEYNKINSGLMSMGQLQLAFDKANIDANVKKEIGILGSAKGLAKRGMSGVTTAIAGTAAGILDLLYYQDPSKGWSDSNAVWGQASNYLHKVANESNYIYGIDDSAERTSYKTFENGMIEFKKGNWGRGLWNFAKAVEQGGLQVTVNSLGYVAGIAITSIIPGGLFTKVAGMSKNAAQLTSQITMYGLMEANADIYERYKNNNYKQINDTDKAGIYLGSFINAGIQMGVFHHIIGKNGPVIKSLTGEEIALQQLNKIAQERVKLTVGRNFIKRTVPSMAEESIAETIETLYDEIAQKLGTEKYKDKNSADIIDDAFHEAVYSALMGAGSGAIMVSPRTIGETIALFNDNVYAKLNPEEFISERVHDALEGMDESAKKIFKERLNEGIKAQQEGVTYLNSLMDKSPQGIINEVSDILLNTKEPEETSLTDVLKQTLAKNLINKIFTNITSDNLNNMLSTENAIKEVSENLQAFFNTFNNETDQNILLSKVKKVLAENEDITLGVDNDTFVKDPITTINNKLTLAIKNKDITAIKQFINLTKQLNKEFPESEYKDIRQNLRNFNISLINSLIANTPQELSLNNMIKKELVNHRMKTENGVNIQEKIKKIFTQYKDAKTNEVTIAQYNKLSSKEKNKVSDSNLLKLKTQLDTIINTTQDEKEKSHAVKILNNVVKQAEYRSIGKSHIENSLAQIGDINDLTTNEGKKQIYKQFQTNMKSKYENAYNLLNKLSDINIDDIMNNLINIAFANTDESQKAKKLKVVLNSLQKEYEQLINNNPNLTEDEINNFRRILLKNPESIIVNHLFRDIINNKDILQTQDDTLQKQLIDKDLVNKINKNNFSFYREIIQDYLTLDEELGSTIEENDFQTIFNFIKDNSEAFEALLKANTYEEFKKDYIEVNREALETGFDTKKGEHRAGVKEYNDFTENIDKKSIDEIEKDNKNLLKFVASRAINKISEWGKRLRNKEPISGDAIKTILHENGKIVDAVIDRYNAILDKIDNTDDEKEIKQLNKQLDKLNKALYLLPHMNESGDIIVEDKNDNTQNTGINIEDIENSPIELIKAYRDALSQNHEDLMNALKAVGHGGEETFNKIINAFGKNKSKSSTPKNNQQSKPQKNNSTQTNQQKTSTIKLVENSPAYKKSKQEIDNLLSQVIPKLGSIKPGSTYTIDKNIGVYVSKKSTDNEYKVTIIKKDGEHTLKTLVLKVRDNDSKQYKNFIVVENYDVFDLNELSSEMLKNNADFKTNELLNNFIKKLALTTIRLFKNDKFTNIKGIIKPDGKGGMTAVHLPFLHISAQKTDKNGNKIEDSGTYAFIFKLAQDSKTGTSTFVRINYDIENGKFFVKSSRKIIVNENEDNTEYVEDLLDSSMVHLFGSNENVKLVLSKMQTLGSKYDFSFPADIDFVSTLQNDDLTKLLLNKVSNIGKTITTSTNTVPNPTPTKPKNEGKSQTPIKEPKVENIDEIERNLNKVKKAFSGGITSTDGLVESIENTAIDELDIHDVISEDLSNTVLLDEGKEFKLTQELNKIYKDIKIQRDTIQSLSEVFKEFDIFDPEGSTLKQIKKAYRQWIKQQEPYTQQKLLKKETYKKMNLLIKDFYEFSKKDKNYLYELDKLNAKISKLNNEYKQELMGKYPELNYVSDQVKQILKEDKLDGIENTLKIAYNTLHKITDEIEKNCK